MTACDEASKMEDHSIARRVVIRIACRRVWMDGTRRLKTHKMYALKWYLLSLKLKIRMRMALTRIRSQRFKIGIRPKILLTISSLLPKCCTGADVIAAKHKSEERA